MIARVEDLEDAGLARWVEGVPLPHFESTPWIEPPELRSLRLAIVTTAGLHRRDDAAFDVGEGSYRVLPGDISAHDLLMSHISVNFDRSGFQEDANLVFPIDHLRAMAAEGSIGSLADFHYSFMGASDPEEMAVPARQIAGMLKNDQVDAVLLTPV
jgi:D-proline reductase (dithiol) PrdB